VAQFLPCASAVSADAAQRAPYHPRNPQGTVLYALVQRHALTLFHDVRERHPLGFGLPAFVEHEFLRYLDCGLLSRGFVRVHCAACGDDQLVAFSCKGRGFCPSCTGRRMHDTAAHLVDRVLPDVSYRQWVLSVPRPLRLLLSVRPALIGPVLQIFLRAVFAWQRRRARRRGITDGNPGAVTFIQLFGSALNRNVHFHALVPDGVFVRSATSTVSFASIPPPSDDDILAVTCRIYRRVATRLAKVEDVNDDGEHAAAQLYAAALAHPRGPEPSISRLLGRRCALVDGFSLHANVHIAAGHPGGLELLARYGARPPLALSRLSTLPDGRVLYRFKRALHNGTTHLALAPVEFLRKLAALVPPPRLHLVRYHGVFAPNAKLRSEVVPRKALVDPIRVDQPEVPAPQTRQRRLDWAALLRRVFAVDVLQCPRCDGRMKIVAFITDSTVAQRILSHLHLPVHDPAPRPARAPPLPTAEDPFAFDVTAD